MRFLYLLVVTILTSTWANAQVVHEFMDLQSHLTMSFAYPFFQESLREGSDIEIEKLSHKHTFKNVIYSNLLKNNKGSRIVINGAIPFEYLKKKEKVKRSILKQIEAINDFAALNSKDFAVAKTPQEVRTLIHETNKTVIIHSIEGANHLITSQADADFWASKGVAFITLIHLVDSDYGGAALTDGLLGKLLNYRGTLKKLFHPKRYRGLSDHGKQTVRWLARAGVMVDLTHMSHEAVDDALEILRELNLPPLATHSQFSLIQQRDMAFNPEQLLELYHLGGLFSLPISGESLIPVNPSEEFLTYVQDKEICLGSLDSYRVSFQFTQEFLLKSLLGKDVTQLTEEERIEYSMGWQSDFNGWLNHSRPRYGKSGCLTGSPSPELKEIELKGLAHPGLLPQYWDVLEKEGMDTSTLKYASEKFLRIWEKFRIHSF